MKQKSEPLLADLLHLAAVSSLTPMHFSAKPSLAFGSRMMYYPSIIVGLSHSYRLTQGARDKVEVFKIHSEVKFEKPDNFLAKCFVDINWD